MDLREAMESAQDPDIHEYERADLERALRVLATELEDGPTVEDIGALSAQLDDVLDERDHQREINERVIRERDALRAELGLAILSRDARTAERKAIGVKLDRVLEANDRYYAELDDVTAERAALSTLLRGMARRATLLRGVMTHAMAENERLRAEVADYARRVTTGGPTKPIDTTWANADLPAPTSADDPSAPPLRTGRGSDRMGEK